MFNKIVLFLVLVSVSSANIAVIEDVSVTKNNNVYHFDVRILHEDSGWDHYVNLYEVLDIKGKVLGKRVLWHPHEHEQPFTRSLGNVSIFNLKTVYIRARDSVDGYSELYEVILP